MRVGERIVGELTYDELKEFDVISNPKEVAKWLEKHVPNFRSIVVEERARVDKIIRVKEGNAYVDTEEIEKKK